MDLAAIQSPAAAFSAGIVTSLHCAGMCGPIACWLMPRSSGDDALTLQTTYQVTRLASYTLLGALAGVIGSPLIAFFDQAALRFLPWALVAFFVALALRLDKRIPRLALLGRLTLHLQNTLRRRSPLAAAALLGIATPLLPCGPLYFVFALPALSGSALRGTEVMLAFGLGTLPLLWLVQANLHWLRARLTPRQLPRIQTALALSAALIISWRLRSTLGYDGPGFTNWVCF